MTAMATAAGATTTTSTPLSPPGISISSESSSATEPASSSTQEFSQVSRLDGIVFVCPILEHCYSAVIDHLRQNFFADEPLNRSVDLCRRGEPHKELEEHSLMTMRDQLSIAALDAHTGEVIGVALNGILHESDLENAQEKISSLSDPKFQRIISLLSSVNRQLDLFARFGVTRIFECRILSVDSRYRGRRLASELLRRSEEVARENGFKLFKEDSTGLYSQRVAESLGLRTVHSLAYADYTNPETGEVVFKTSEPHQYFKVMVKELP